jgi:hypothetical protein
MTTLLALLTAAAVQAPPSAAAVEATHKRFLDLETRLMGAVLLRRSDTLERYRVVARPAAALAH